MWRPVQAPAIRNGLLPTLDGEIRRLEGLLRIHGSIELDSYLVLPDGIRPNHIQGSNDRDIFRAGCSAPRGRVVNRDHQGARPLEPSFADGELDPIWTRVGPIDHLFLTIDIDRGR